MSDVIAMPVASWDGDCTAAVHDVALRAIERGSVIAIERLPFVLLDDEHGLLAPALAGRGKNISLDADGGRLRGSAAEDAALNALRAMMRRFAEASATLVRNLLPRYARELQRGRTSFRPLEIEGRPVSWRKDDTRLHVDSFPSSPVQGRRILRVFTNVNREGQARVWRIGEPFEAVAQRYAGLVRFPPPGMCRALQMLGLTRGRRSSYDHLMLQLHDRMKADLAYQSAAAQTRHSFLPGSTWLLFSDQVSHAAMSGQFALEQTFYVPVSAMLEPERSPLRTLERLFARPLI